MIDNGRFVTIRKIKQKRVLNIRTLFMYGIIIIRNLNTLTYCN